VIFQVDVFWAVSSCNAVVGYQRSEAIFTLKMKAAQISVNPEDLNFRPSFLSHVCVCVCLYIQGYIFSKANYPLFTYIQCRGQRMRGAIPPLPQYVFMAWCLVKHRGNSGSRLPLYAMLYIYIYNVWWGVGVTCVSLDLFSLLDKMGENLRTA
jgi:hypothetical protein